MANTSTTTRSRSQGKSTTKPESKHSSEVGTLNGATKAARDASKEALKKAQHKGRQHYDDGSEMLSSAQSEFDQVVRRNPTIAMLGALGLGILIGIATRSRS